MIRIGRSMWLKNVLYPATEIVEASFTVGGAGEAVLGAAPVTGKPHLAALAELGKGVPFVESELDLLLRGHQLGHRGLGDVAQQVVGLDVVVARVQITVVLQGQRQPAGLREDAQSRRLPVPVRQRHVEVLDEDLTDVSLYPLVEDRRQEPPERLRVAPCGP